VLGGVRGRGGNGWGLGPRRGRRLLVRIPILRIVTAIRAARCDDQAEQGRYGPVTFHSWLLLEGLTSKIGPEGARRSPTLSRVTASGKGCSLRRPDNKHFATGSVRWRSVCEAAHRITTKIDPQNECRRHASRRTASGKPNAGYRR